MTNVLSEVDERPARVESARSVAKGLSESAAQTIAIVTVRAVPVENVEIESDTQQGLDQMYPDLSVGSEHERRSLRIDVFACFRLLTGEYGVGGNQLSLALIT